MAFHISIIVKFKQTSKHLLRQSLCRCSWFPTQCTKWSAICHWNQVTRCNNLQIATLPHDHMSLPSWLP